MTSLFVDRRNADLDYETDRLVVRVAGEREGTFPLADLERVVLRGGGHISTRLLGRLWRDGIGLLLLSGHQRFPSVELTSRRGDDTVVRLAQHALLGDAPARLAVAQRLVASKLRCQRRSLRVLAPRPGPRVRDALATLDQSGAQCRDTQDRGSLRGIEGAAARRYFTALAEVVPASLRFTGRNRRPPRDPLNVCLSLGYTLLHADAVRAAAAAGLDPAVGIFHDPRRQRDSLACDLAEPLRPEIDRFAVELFRKGIVRIEDFAVTAAACRLNKSGRRAFYRRWEDSAAPWRRALRRIAGRLAVQLRRGGDRRLEMLETEL